MAAFETNAAERHPSLRAEIETADRVLVPAFEDADRKALEYQRKFRRAELAVIYGSVLAVALGLAASVTGTNAYSFFELVLTAGLGSIAFISKGLKWQRRWLRSRWLAETLRGEHLMFVGQLGDYAGAEDPEVALRRRLVDIERAAREGQTDG